MSTQNPYPASRPFTTSYVGACAWSGETIRAGATVRFIIDGYDAATSTEFNKRIVLERFVQHACDPQWRRITPKISLAALLIDGATYVLATRAGGHADTRHHVYDGDENVFRCGLTTWTRAQFERMFNKALGVKVCPPFAR